MPTDARRLEFLLAVARQGGILAAAESLHVTPSAVSQQISKLESEEKVRLLDRGPRGVTLTRAGRVLAEAAENIERELIEARRRVMEIEGEVSGTVVIGAFQTVITGVLAPMLAAFQRDLPGVDVVISETPSSKLPGVLRSGDADVVILERDLDADHPAPRYTREVPLLDEPWRLIVPRDALSDQTVPDLDRLSWLGIDPDGASAQAFARVSANLKLTPRTAHSYSDFSSALSLVAAGQGVALLPALALERDLPDGIEIIDLPGLGSRRLVLRHRQSKREPSTAALAVIEAIVHKAGQLSLA
ncbi:LysR family transcriptional regulator [Arthrobacter tecti]